MSGEETEALPTRSVPPSVSARQARAAELRPHVARWVEVLGAPAVAARAEQKPNAVRAFVYRGATPQPGAMDAYEEMMQDAVWLATIPAEIGQPIQLLRGWTGVTGQFFGSGH